VRGQAELELEPEEPQDWVASLLRELGDEGLRVQHGRWLVPGRPRALLVDPELPAQRLEALRQRLALDHAIQPAYGNPLVDTVLSFGEGVRRLVTAATRHARAPDAAWRGAGTRVVAHFHEWLCGAALSMLRREAVPCATVFTTHATSVGRYVASSEPDFYDRLPHLDGEAEARDYAILTQHQIERACARDCHLFTTVSPITVRSASGCSAVRPT
jgi:glycogen(starch) synthase